MLGKAKRLHLAGICPLVNQYRRRSGADDHAATAGRFREYTAGDMVEPRTVSDKEILHVINDAETCWYDPKWCLYGIMVYWYDDSST